MKRNKIMDKKRKSISFWVCLIVSVGLFIGGFLVPPIGVIDGSVLKAIGLLLSYSVIDKIPDIVKIIKEVDTARFTKGDMSIELGKNKEE